MKYTFPHITHLDEVKEAIHGVDEFFIADNINHFIANYRLYHHEMMPDPMEEGISDEEYRARAIKKECRGMIFDGDGNIISRRFHKFHNLNERPEYASDCVDLLSPGTVVLEKLDGSMIAPYILDDVLQWGTKMGHQTEIAELVTNYIYNLEDSGESSRLYSDFACYSINELNHTPIFEFCSRMNRVVIDYPRTDMVLLAMREINTGEYMSIEEMEKHASKYNIPVVMSISVPKSGNIDEYAEHIKEQEGIEGIIVRLPNGHMVKIKAEQYVLLHRTKDQISLEKNVLRTVLEDGIDDLLPLVIEQDVKDKLIEYQAGVLHDVMKLHDTVVKIVMDNAKLSQKEFALYVIENHKEISSILFKVRAGNDAWKAINKFLLSFTGSANKVERIRNIITPRWKELLCND